MGNSMSEEQKEQVRAKIMDKVNSLIEEKIPQLLKEHVRSYLKNVNFVNNVMEKHPDTLMQEDVDNEFNAAVSAALSTSNSSPNNFPNPYGNVMVNDPTYAVTNSIMSAFSDFVASCRDPEKRKSMTNSLFSQYVASFASKITQCRGLSDLETSVICSCGNDRDTGTFVASQIKEWFSTPVLKDVKDISSGVTSGILVNPWHFKPAGSVVFMFGSPLWCYTARELTFIVSRHEAFQTTCYPPQWTKTMGGYTIAPPVQYTNVATNKSPNNYNPCNAGESMPHPEKRDD